MLLIRVANTFIKVRHALIFSKHIKGFLRTPSPRGEGRGGVTKDNMSAANTFYKVHRYTFFDFAPVFKPSYLPAVFL